MSKELELWNFIASRLNDGESVGPALLDPALCRLRALGGSCRLWGGGCVPLTRLDLERLLKSGRDFKAQPLRPCILDFLANYRDLQELGTKSPKELYLTIIEKRMKRPPLVPSPAAGNNPGDFDDG